MASDHSMRDMTQSIVHRGPDGGGAKSFHHGNLCIALGHRRLSIVDVAGGSQPMTNEDGTIWIVFNGEIYNHKDLRSKLEAAGHRYSSRSDTETILHAYEQWGEECLNYLQGMFAFAIWDDVRRTLFVARDRVGIKPLYYSITPDGLIFASEIKAILASGHVNATLNVCALPEQMALGYIADDRTMFSGIRKLMPGHYLKWRNGDLRIRQYWEIPAATHDVSCTDAEWIERFTALFDETVQSHLMSDVPLGVFLSGGLDSSAIAATMARHVPGRLKTFSVGYEESRFSELSHARTVAEHLGSEHHEVVLTPQAFLESLAKMVWHEDEPIRSSPSIALYHVAKLASEHVKVVLTGEGSDELFAGYDRYWATLFNLKWGSRYERMVPKWIRKQCLGQRIWNLPLPVSVRRALSHTFLACQQQADALIFDNWYSILPRGSHSSLFTPEVLEQVVGVDPYASSVALWNERNKVDLLEAMLYVDQKTYLVELLMKQDSMSMAASIESRVPFLDHRMVEFATGVPRHLKIHGRGGKWLVKQALQRILPPAIVNRKKTGFPVPVSDWLRGPLSGALRTIVLGERTGARGLVRAEFVERLLQENQARTRNHTEPLWSLLNLEIWARIFLDGDSPEDIFLEMAGDRRLGRGSLATVA